MVVHSVSKASVSKASVSKASVSKAKVSQDGGLDVSLCPEVSLSRDELAAQAGLSVAGLDRCCQSLPADVLQLTSSDRLLLLAPLAHWRSAALVCAATQAGAEVWVLEEFDPRIALEIINYHQITLSDWLPWQMGEYLTEFSGSQDNAQTVVGSIVSHRAVWVGGARLPVWLHNELVVYWGPVLFQHHSHVDWPGCFVATHSDLLERPGTAGRWHSGEGLDSRRLEVKLLDKGGQLCLPQQIGRLVVVQKQTVEQQTDSLNAPAEEELRWQTQEQLGFFEDNWFYALGRRRNAMATQYGWLTAYEAEHLLEHHPAVEEAALLASQQEIESLEHPEGASGLRTGFSQAGFYAVIKLVQEAQPGTPLLELELLDYCAGALSADKCPMAVVFATVLPRTVSGAIDMTALADFVLSDLDPA